MAVSPLRAGSMRLLRLACFALALLCCAALPSALAAENLLRNGDFAADTDADGMADDWHFSGDPGVIVNWSREAGQEGKYSQRLTCTSFTYSGAASHVMLSQEDTFGLKEGQWYTLSFNAKGDRLARAASVGIQHTGPWEPMGLMTSFRLRPEWRSQSFTFQATKTLPDHLRLQIWFTGTGSMWIDHVQLVECLAPDQTPHYGETLPDLGAKNLLPNSSFECGASGWGSIGTRAGWAGGPNSLVGAIDARTAAMHGSSFRLELDKAHPIVLGWDYFEAIRVPLLFAAVANRGWVSVTPGQPYTLSAYVKSDPAEAPVLFVVQEAFHWLGRQEVKTSGEWQRVSYTFTPSTSQLYVGVGLDLTQSPLSRATLWVDGVQLEKGAQATAYAPRAPVEIGLEWAQPGHLFTSPKEARAILTAFNAGPAAARVHLRAPVTDFFDRTDRTLTAELALPAGQAVRRDLPLGVKGKGFYRVALASDVGATIPTRAERFAVLDPHPERAGLFGMNHAYAPPEMLRVSKQIGLTWFRDWSLKWQQVEPEKGRFVFSDTDFQIARVQQEGLNVLGLLPFPSSDWASRAPAEVTSNDDMGQYARQAYQPRDLGEYADYVRRTVTEYRDRIHVWEIMNEPIYTGYALPTRLGYTVADYVAQLKVAYQAVKSVDQSTIVIGGIAAPPETLTREFADAGGLQYVDALNLHMYPGLTPPEDALAGLEGLRARLREAGKPDLPIYFTEGAYYADDDLPILPQPPSSWMALLDSELECASYEARFDLLLLAHGTRLIINHAGTSGSLNDESLEGIFYEWDSAPRKMAVSRSVLASLLAADTHYLGTVWEGVRSLAFRSRGRTVVAVWDDQGQGRTLNPARGATLLDLSGAAVTRPVTVGETPYFIVLPGQPPLSHLRTTLRGCLP